MISSTDFQGEQVMDWFDWKCKLIGHWPRETPSFLLKEKQAQCHRCFRDIPGLMWVPVFDTVTGRCVRVELINDNL